MTDHRNDAGRPQESPGLCTKIRDSIVSLTDSATELQQAIIRRDVGMIWETLAVQQELSSDLEGYMNLWQQLYAGNDGQFSEERQELREKMERLRSVEQTNASLSQSYLGAIRKALGEAGARYAKKKNVYNRFGRTGDRYSLLINRLG